MKRSALACALVLAACAGGTETGNPPGAAEVALWLETSDTTVAAPEPGQGGVWARQVWLSLGELALMPCASDGAPLSVLDAPRAIDLALEPPSLAPVDASGEAYCGVRLALAPADAPPADAPSALAGNSVVITGERADAAPFELVSSATPTLTLHPASGLDALGDANALLLAFDLAAWFSAVDLASASTAGDGSVHVDHADNAALLTTFDAHFAQALSLHADRDGDGVLDDDEREPVATPGP